MKRKLADALTRSMAAAFVVALGVSSAATAADAMKGSMNFNQLDQDGNGLISQTEAEQDMALSDRFQEADRDGNGQLDEAEFSAFETMNSGTTDKAKGQ